MNKKLSKEELKQGEVIANIILAHMAVVIPSMVEVILVKLRKPKKKGG
jgi:hypothetical protein